ATRLLPSFPTRRSSDLIKEGALIATSRTMRDEFLGIGGGFMGGATVGKASNPAPQIVFGGDFGAVYLGGVEAQMWFFGRAHTGRSEEHTSELQSRSDLV